MVALGHNFIMVNQDRWEQMPQDLHNILLEETQRHEELSKRKAIGPLYQQGID